MKTCVVLIVEDEPDSADQFVAFLKGVKRLEAVTEICALYSSKEAFKFLKDDLKDRHCLMIMDINLETPGAGYALFGACQKRTPRIPVIVISSRPTHEQDMELAYNAGALKYLPKPFNPIEFAGMVENHFENLGLLDPLLDLGRGYQLDKAQRVILHGPKSIRIHRPQYVDLLVALCESAPGALTTDRAEAILWGEEQVGYETGTITRKIDKVNDTLAELSLPFRIRAKGKTRAFEGYQLIQVSPEEHNLEAGDADQSQPD